VLETRLAISCSSWGVDYVDTPGNPPWETVLDEIAEAGYCFVELGPVGYLPDTVAGLREALEGRGLQLTSGFVFEPFHLRDATAEILATARRNAALIAGVGGTHFMLIPALASAREPLAGNSERAPRLEPDQRARMLRSLEEVAKLARDEFGLATLVHPHAGTYVEFEDEIDALMEGVDGSLLNLCLDTGQARYGGSDPVALYERYADRIPYVHLKDIDGDVHARSVSEGVGFLDSVGRGVHPPLGTGLVDFAGFADALARKDFKGWATIEHDRDPAASASSKDDAIKNLAFAREIGFTLDWGEAG
jgi:inosose dehydratase